MIVIEPYPIPAGAGVATHRRPPISKRELQRFLALAKKAVPVRGAVTVLLAGDASIRALNRRFRHKDKATDVLSFPAADMDAASGRNRIAGDLAISLETAARQAEVFRHPLIIEVKILMLHGLLHLAGFDHEADAGEMARREQALRTEFDLPAGLIQRTSSAVGKADVSKARHRAPAVILGAKR
jgi:probable rRNA maturation factor